MNQKSIDEWLAEILSEDASAFEDAYWGHRPPSIEAVPKILEALRVTRDPLSKGKLLELLGESGDLSVLSTLEQELNNPDQTVRDWASTSIQALKSGETWQRSL